MIAGLSWRRKLENVGAETTSSGSPFQIRGPETLKVRLPSVMTLHAVRCTCYQPIRVCGPCFCTWLHKNIMTLSLTQKLTYKQKQGTIPIWPAAATAIPMFDVDASLSITSEERSDLINYTTIFCSSCRRSGLLFGFIARCSLCCGIASQAYDC